MKRVALICYHSCPTARLGEPDAGGMSVYVRNMARELGAAGVQVDIFSRRHDPDEPAVMDLSDRVRLVHIDAGPTRLRKDQLPRYLFTFYRNLQAWVARDGRGYDLIHSHYWLSGRVGLVLGQAWRRPHVATFHTLAEVKRLVQDDTSDPPQRNAVERRVVAGADAMQVSDRHEQEALAQLYGADPLRIRVIPCGVDPILFHPMEPGEARRALGLDDTPMILFVGRLSPIKGLDLLFHMLSGMEEQPELKLFVVGGEPESEGEALRLVGLARELGLESRVRFEGIVPQERLPLYYNAAQALVMPSYYESFGLVALEAMACGTPVVAARVGGLASLVRDWDTGCLVTGHCPESFAQRLETLLSHPGLRDSMGQAARRYAEQFRWSDVAERTLGLYGELEREGSAVVAGGDD